MCVYMYTPYLCALIFILKSFSVHMYGKKSVTSVNKKYPLNSLKLWTIIT